MGHSNPYMASLYLRTEFEPNTFINDWDMAKNPKSNVAAAAVLNFGESGIFGYSYQIWSMYITILNSKQVSS